MSKKSEIMLSLMVILIFGGIFVGLSFLMGAFNPTLSLLFIGGLILGSKFPAIDEKFIYRYYSEEGENTPLISRSLAFMIVLIPLSLFVVTSTGSTFGSGFILGLVAILVGEMLMLNRQTEQFKKQFLSQLKRDVSATEIRNVSWLWAAFLVLLAFLYFI